MPRRSQIEETGTGPLVMHLALQEGLSVPKIIDRVEREKGVRLTTDSVRGFLKTAPPKFVEVIKERGELDRLAPIFDYASKIQGLFTQVDSLKNKIADHLEPSFGTPAQAFIDELVRDFPLSGEQAKELVKRIRKHVVGPDLMRQFLASMSEMRKMLELAHKMDSRIERKPPTPPPIQFNGPTLLTGESLVDLVQEARKQYRPPSGSPPRPPGPPEAPQSGSST